MTASQKTGLLNEMMVRNPGCGFVRRLNLGLILLHACVTAMPVGARLPLFLVIHRFRSPKPLLSCTAGRISPFLLHVRCREEVGVPCSEGVVCVAKNDGPCR